MKHETLMRVLHNLVNEIIKDDTEFEQLTEKDIDLFTRYAVKCIDAIKGENGK